jgi:hypothetical protein
MTADTLRPLGRDWVDQDWNAFPPRTRLLVGVTPFITQTSAIFQQFLTYTSKGKIAFLT